MIITRLIGGLGNQMFQYAVARSIAHQQQTDFMLDLSAYDSDEAYDTPRKYELGCFKIVEKISPKGIKQEFIKKSFLRKYGGKVFPVLQKNIYIKEKNGFQFVPTLFRRKGNVYIEGYWQSEKYFKNIESIIRDDFMVKSEPDEKNAQVLIEIKNCSSVAVHVRRGDYVTNPIAREYHGICTLEYYQKAIALIAQKITSPHFFIFSDDAKWTIANVRIEYPATFVSHNSLQEGHEDLRLMSHCKHFIIANSSFSWWGAWLSRHNEKIIVAPKMWIKKEGTETPDLIPKNWITI